MSKNSVLELGCLPYAEVRRIQEDLIEQRRQDKIADTLVVCEHPLLITLGKRSHDDFDALSQGDTPVIKVKRGGLATIHNPGQLILYPIVSLKQRGWGVKRFICEGLEIFAECIREQGLPVKALLEPAGVWTLSGETADKKLTAVGLQIVNGISNHGFSLNLHNDLEVFSKIAPCGLNRNRVGSVREELKGKIELEVLREQILSKWRTLLER